jgi:phenylacetate-coenzyme A ligase PaaK-like adenylate-forming protein
LNLPVPTGPEEFSRLALETFRFQAEENPVYREYLRLLGCDPAGIQEPGEIPFMPIEFFRTHRVVSGPGKDIRVFESSGTTGAATSRHHITDENLYVESLTTCFNHFFGPPGDFCFLALLPSYLERGSSSLVFMMDRLINLSRDLRSGFYLNQYDELETLLAELETEKRKTMLVGVSFALLDLAERHPMHLRNTILVETGGMKGRRAELTRDELHALLKKSFRLPSIASEYGMTELLSQAWSMGEGIYSTPPWMKILIRDAYDPFERMPVGRAGGIDVIDLANRYSCSFIQTQDLGRLHPGGTFEVLGRFDNSELRGCNLMVTGDR